MPIETPPVTPVATPTTPVAPLDRKSKLEAVLKVKPLPPEQQQALRDLFTAGDTNNTKIRGALDPLPLDNDSKNQIWKAYYSLDPPPPKPKPAPVLPTPPPAPPAMLRENQPYMKHLAPAPLPPPPVPEGVKPPVVPAITKPVTTPTPPAPTMVREKQPYMQHTAPPVLPPPPVPAGVKPPDYEAMARKVQLEQTVQHAGATSGMQKEFSQKTDTLSTRIKQVAPILEAQIQKAIQTKPELKNNPEIQKWLSKPGQPSPAHAELVEGGILDKSLDVAANSFRAIGAGVESGTTGFWNAVEGIADLLEKNVIGSMEQYRVHAPGTDTTPMLRELMGEKYDPVKILKRMAAEAAAGTGAAAEQIRGEQEGAGGLEKSIYQGFESAGQMGLTVPLSILTGNPTPALTGMGLISGGQAYAQGREEGLSPTKAALFGAIQGTIEVWTEKIPLEALMGDLAKGTGLFKTVLHQLKTEIPQEEVATLTQDMNQWAMIDRNKGKTFADYLNERPSAAADTLVSTIVATVAFTTPTHLLNKAATKKEVPTVPPPIDLPGVPPPGNPPGAAPPGGPPPGAAGGTPPAASGTPPGRAGNAAIGATIPEGAIAPQTTPGMPSISMTPPAEGAKKPEIPSVPVPETSSPIPASAEGVETPETPPKSVVPEEVGIDPPKKQFTHAGQYVVGMSEGKIVLADGSLVERAPSYIETLGKFGYPEVTPEQIATLAGLAAAKNGAVEEEPVTEPIAEVPPPLEEQTPQIFSSGKGPTLTDTREGRTPPAAKPKLERPPSAEGPIEIPEKPGTYVVEGGKAKEVVGDIPSQIRDLEKLLETAQGLAADTSQPFDIRAEADLQAADLEDEINILKKKDSELPAVPEAEGVKPRVSLSELDKQISTLQESIDADYEAGLDPAEKEAELERLETEILNHPDHPEFGEKPQEEVGGPLGHATGSLPLSESASIEEQLAEGWRRLQGKQDPTERQYIIDGLRESIQFNGGRVTPGEMRTDISDQEILDAAKDAFEQKEVIRQKLKSAPKGAVEKAKQFVDEAKVPKAIEGPKAKGELPAVPEAEATKQGPSYRIEEQPDGTFGIINPKGKIAPGGPYSTRSAAEAEVTKLQSAFDKLVGAGTTVIAPTTPAGKPVLPPPPKAETRAPAVDLADVAKKALQTPPSEDRLAALKKKMAQGPATSPPSPLMSEMAAIIEESDSVTEAETGNVMGPERMGRYVDNAPTTTSGHPILYRAPEVPEGLALALSTNEELGKFSSLLQKHFDIMTAVLKKHGELLGNGSPQLGISLGKGHLGGHVLAKHLGRKPGNDLIVIQPYRVLAEIEIMIFDGKISRADTARHFANRLVFVLPHEYAHGPVPAHNEKHTGQFGRNADILFDELMTARNEIRDLMEADDYAIYNNFLTTHRELQGFWQGGLSGHAGMVPAAGSGAAGGEGDLGAGPSEGNRPEGTVSGRSGWETTDMATSAESGSGAASFTDLDEASQSTLIELGSYQYQTTPDWNAWRDAMSAFGDWAQPYLASAFDFIDNVAAFTGVAEPVAAKQPELKPPPAAEEPARGPPETKGELPDVPEIRPAPGESGAIHAGGAAGTGGEVATQGTVEQGTGQPGTSGGGSTPSVSGRKPRPRGNVRTGERGADAITRGGIDNSGFYRITEADKLGEGGAVSKFKRNIAAIKILKSLQEEKRLPTEDERKVLASYVGWGSLSQQAFDRHAPETGPLARELEQLISYDEFQAARKSTVNAHYTSPETVKFMWDLATRLGFKGNGTILEPAMGTGNFLGMAPDSAIQRGNFIGTELDQLTGSIAKYLYPGADIRVTGYENLAIPDNTVDIAISNVPFGEKIYDPAYPKLNARIHDYFFIKTLDKIRPGGILMFITSKGTMDKANDRIREMMADKADLVAAYRLPNTAFAKNAGTEVTTDIIILQKREASALRGGESFLASKEISPGLSINEYYIKHPENMFGKMTLGGTMYRGGESTLEPTLPLPQMMAKAMETAPKNVFKGKIRASGGTSASIADQLAPDNIKDLAYTLNDKGQLVQNIGGMLKAPRDPAVSARSRIPQMKDLIGLREQLKKLILSQLMSSDDVPVKIERDMLNTMYDDYVKQYGILHDRKTDIFSEDPQYTLLLALENYDVESKAATKAAIFTKRTIPALAPLEVVSENPKEGLLQVLGERGFPDIPFLAELSDKPEEEVVKSLENENLVFHNPASGNYEMSDIYLSGRTRDKLEQAEQAADRDPKFNRNVDALKKAQPEDTAIENIFPVLGQTWIPAEAFRDFIKQVINEQAYGGNRVEVRLIPDGTWNVKFSSPGDADLKWGSWTPDPSGGKSMDFSAKDLVDKAMNMRRPVVIRKDSDGNKWTDKEATINAREKMNEIQEAFQRWARTNETWSPQIAKIFNRQFNAIKGLTYDGSHLSFPGMNTEKSLVPHQKDVAWRIIVDGRVLMAHAVGTGKTYAMIAAGMELRRLGISKKNMYVVPNNKVSQWTDEFMSLYPAANILSVGRDDLGGDRRRETISRIATGDWDAVILQHSSFGLIPISPERMRKTIDNEMDALEETLMQAQAAARSSGSNKKDPSVKALEKAKDKLTARLNALADMPHDNTIYFDHLGVDYMFVDEIHEFKNLNYYTKMGNVSGLSQSDAKKGLDLKSKAEYIQEKNRGRGVIGATGTPISNSMAEMYNMTRYIAPDVLETAGISAFDAWAATFGEIRNVFELSADGRTYRPRPKFSHFINVQGLLQMFRSFADVKHSWELKLKIPTIKGGSPQDVEVKSNEIMEPVFETLLHRAEHLRRNPSSSKQKGSDNWLTLTADGKKVALDLRLYDASLPDHPLSKSNIAVDGIYERWKTTEDKTQIVFADLYQDETKKFNLYEDMKAKLVKRGIPESQIAIAHDFNSDDQLLKMQQQMNSGKIRILFGSTAKIGVGLNVQRLLQAQHNLDAPWRPDQVEQRQGRTVRQGNLNPEVEVLNYVTEHSFDAYIFQALETKARFVGTAMSGDFKGFEMDDAAGAVVMNFAASKALASGNPDVQLKVKLEQEINILGVKKRNHDADEDVKRNSIRQREEIIRSIHAQAAHLEKAKAEYDQYMADHPVPEKKEKLTKEQEDLLPKYSVRQNGISKLFQVVDPEGNPMQKLNKLGDMIDVFYDTEKEALTAAKHEQAMASGGEDWAAEGQLFDAIIGGQDFKSKDDLIAYITENKDKVMQTGALATIYGVPVKFEAVFAKAYKSTPMKSGDSYILKLGSGDTYIRDDGSITAYTSNAAKFKTEGEAATAAVKFAEGKINHRYLLANSWEDVPETVPGFLQSVKFRLGRIGGIIQTRNENVVEQQRVIDSVQKELGKPFRYQEDLDKATTQLKEVDARLKPVDDKKQDDDEVIDDEDYDENDTIVTKAKPTPGKEGDIPPPIAGPAPMGRDYKFPEQTQPQPVLLKPPLTVGMTTYEPVIIKRTTPDGKMREPLAGWEIAPGLAVAESTDAPGRFQITHMLSGSRITDAASVERAVSVAKQFSRIGDWAVSLEEILATPGFTKRIQDLINQSEGQRGGWALFSKKPPQKIPESVVRSPRTNIQTLFNKPQTVTNAWESIKGLPALVKRTAVDPFIYNQDIKMWPVFAEMVRRFQENPSDAATQAATKIEQILHGMDNSEFQVFTKIVYLEDLYESAVSLGEDAVPVVPDPNTGRSVIDDIEEEIERLRTFVATPAVLASVDRHHVWMQDVWDDLVRRGKVEENAGRIKYYPNYIRRFGEGKDNVLGLPYRMKDPKRMYLKQRKGHEQIHDSNYVAVMEQYATRVFIDNAIDDFIEATAELYDLRTGSSPEVAKLPPAGLQQLLAKGMKPGDIFELADGRQFKVYQFSPGRVMYPARVINDYVIQDAINAGVDELGIDIDKLRQAFQNGRSGLQAPPQLETVDPSGMGEELTRHGVIMGGQHKMYLLPREITDKLMRFRDASSPNPMTELARVATKAFKMQALHFNVLSWQGQNIFSNNIMAAVEDIAILGRQKEALQLLRGKLTGPQYDILLSLIHDARVWNSTFLGVGGSIGRAINRPGLRPYRAGVTGVVGKLNPFGDNPIGDFWRAYEGKLRMLESIPKVASFLENHDRVMRGLPVKHVAVSLGGLDPTSVMAIGRVARELNGDYGATNPKARAIQTILFPFSTWYIRIVPQVARALRHKIDPKADIGLILVASMFIASYLWNHLHHWETEKKLDWQKEMLHINTGFFDEKGNPFIWSEQTPQDAFLQMFGLHTFSSNLDRVMSGEWTFEQAAKKQLSDMVGFQDQAWLPTAQGAMAQQLLNPMISVLTEMAANRDSLTGAEIVKKSNPNQWGTLSKRMPDNPVGIGLMQQYAAKRMISPYMQALRAEQMKDPNGPLWNWITEGPASWKKLLGIRTANLDALDLSKWYDDKNWEQSLLETHSKEIIDTYVQYQAGNIDSEELEDRVVAIMQKDGPSITVGPNIKAPVPGYDVYRMTQTIAFKLQVDKALLGKTTDPVQRQAIIEDMKILEDKLRMESYRGTPKSMKEIGPNGLPYVPQPPVPNQIPREIPPVPIPAEVGQ